MKHFNISIILLLIALTITNRSSALDEHPVLEGPYLGQKPPGLIPDAFAPGIVSTENYELTGVFTPNMKEFYLIRDGGKYEKPSLVVFKNENNRWSESVISDRVGTPVISPDGKTMHLSKQYRTRNETGWSDVKSLGSPFDDLPIMRLTASSKGTYFFDEFKSDFTGDIRYSRLVDGKYEEPKLMAGKVSILLSRQMSPTLYLTVKEKVDMVALIFISVTDKKIVHGAPPLIWATR